MPLDALAGALCVGGCDSDCPWSMQGSAEQVGIDVADAEPEEPSSLDQRHHLGTGRRRGLGQIAQQPEYLVPIRELAERDFPTAAGCASTCASVSRRASAASPQRR